MWIPSMPTVILTSVTAVVGGVCLFKDFYSGPAFDRTLRCDNKVAIVTGANTGIGRETAWELANRGAKVFMACRDMKKCEQTRRDIVMETDNKYVYCRPCDLASLESVRKFVERFKSEEPHLHILVNNAGVMVVEKGVTKDGFETHLGVNHFGHFLLTNLLLDTLKASQPSRVVIVSSDAHRKGKINKDDLNLDKNYDPTEAYNQSKLANIHFATGLIPKLMDAKISVAVVDPGLSDTDLTRNLPMNKSITSYLIYPLFWPFMKTPRLGAQPVLHAALDSSTKNCAGTYLADMKVKDPSYDALDMETSMWLWKVSEVWTKLDYHMEMMKHELQQ